MRDRSDVPWTPTAEHRQFIRRYAAALKAGDVALFAGAGLSRAAGYVDWRSLLKEIADDLKLDIDRETDLIAIAQYHLNTKRTRGRLNQIIIDELNKAAVETPNHALLARLPLPTIWTTNYDQLLERAFEKAGKIVDVKISHENLAQARRGRDVVLYKMHGCVTAPHEAVLAKDDYEKYESRKPLFVESLKGDLITKSFLFLGFSFTDPNVDYILSRVRTLMGENQREHFCIMRRPAPPKRLVGKRMAEFEYEQRKTELRQADLLRFGIDTIWVEQFEHIERLLRSLAAMVHRKSVFVSGAAHVSPPLGSPRLESLVRALGRRVILDGYSLVSGFGYGLGEQCVIGALGALYETPKSSEADRLLVRPFPRAVCKSDQEEQNTRHREDLLSRAGAVVVVSGNRDDGSGAVVNSPGVFEEVDIAKRFGKYVIPVGVTGHAAEEIWKRAIKHPDQYLPGLVVSSELNVLGNRAATNDQILDAIFAILSAAEKAAAEK